MSDLIQKLFCLLQQNSNHEDAFFQIFKEDNYQALSHCLALRLSETPKLIELIITKQLIYDDYEQIIKEMCQSILQLMQMYGNKEFSKLITLIVQYDCFNEN